MFFSGQVTANVVVVAGSNQATCPSGYVVTGCLASPGNDSYISNFNVWVNSNTSPTTCYLSGTGGMPGMYLSISAICAKVCN